VILLQQKRKKWLANDEWLEKNKQEIMNEVLVHERFLQVYEQMENEEVNEAQIRSMSGFFSDEDDRTEIEIEERAPSDINASADGKKK
jgi:exonuclease I